MRLGDLDALKENLKQYFSDGTLDSVSAKLAFNMILRKIDNAPTVKTYCYFCGQTEHGQIEERPQGEWKITGAYPHKVYCDKCYKTYAQENWEVWKDGSLPRNFCPNCGADMRCRK